MTGEQLVEILKTSPVVALILLVLWQYRRDLVKVINKADETSQRFIELLERSVIAHERSTRALEDNESATKQNTAVIQRLVVLHESQRIPGDRSKGY